ncbi:MAG: hypothetical protein KH230_15630 [Enterocloster asparagiformis]|nr:hypothetical protein [Enterocloster asparagiformis]
MRREAAGGAKRCSDGCFFARAEMIFCVGMNWKISPGLIELPGGKGYNKKEFKETFANVKPKTVWPALI